MRCGGWKESNGGGRGRGEDERECVCTCALNFKTKKKKVGWYIFTYYRCFSRAQNALGSPPLLFLARSFASIIVPTSVTTHLREDRFGKAVLLRAVHLLSERDGRDGCVGEDRGGGHAAHQLLSQG